MGKRLTVIFLIVIIVGFLFYQHQRPVHEILEVKLSSPISDPLVKLMSSLLETEHRINSFDFDSQTLVFSNKDIPYNGRISVRSDNQGDVLITVHTYWKTRYFPFASTYSNVDYLIVDTFSKNQKVSYDVKVDQGASADSSSSPNH